MKNKDEYVTVNYLTKIKAVNPVRWTGFLYICMGLAFLVSAVHAQTQQELDRAANESQRIQRDEQKRIEKDMEWFRERKDERGQITIQNDEEGAKKEMESCRDIDEIILNGVTLFSTGDLSGITEKYIGTCMTTADMDRLSEEITKYYFENGYPVARAYIMPRQDLTEGRLGIMVVEGEESANEGKAYEQ